MSLTKQYLRYNPTAQFCVIGSSRCDIAFLQMRSSKSRFVAVGAVENVIVWDMLTKEKVLVLQGGKYEVSALTASPDHDHIAVGYSDGAVRIFNLSTASTTLEFSGHRSAVSCLAYSKDGMLLASGSHDTDAVVWDLVNESGLYRLKGHKDMITHCCFVQTRNMLITSSKDTFIKWWDLDTQHCFKTMVGHRSEVWSFLLSKDEKRLISGSSDSELRVWEIKFIDPDDAVSRTDEEKNSSEEVQSDDEDDLGNTEVICTKLGSIMRKNSGKNVRLEISTDGRHIACYGKEKFVEVYRLATDTELQVKLKRKTKKARKKKKEESESEAPETEQEPMLSLEDELMHIGSVKCKGFICSVDITTISSSGDVDIVALLRNNQIELLNATTSLPHPEFTSSKMLYQAGHRTASRSICFSPDGLALLSTSMESVKLWNRTSQKCIRTLKATHAKCCMFVPGDRQVLIGTEEGSIDIHDIASGMMLQSIPAHTGGVSAVSMYPNKSGIASGGADKSVKFWDFDLIADEKFSVGGKRITLEHTRTLELDDKVLAIDFTSNNRLLAVSLLDCSVKVFYADTLKFFLSLYGHSLPAGCVSVSTDSSLIITGSADRNVKIWGLDFGDCHRSLFAHDDDVTCVKFVPGTHLFFSSGKDGLIKQWDADKFLLIQVLKSHVGPVLTMAVEKDGDFVVSAGKDRSLRVWQRSQEIVIPDEEREQEREEENEKLLAKSKETVVPGEAPTTEAGMASKTTVETVKATERIMEAIELYHEETLKEKEFKASQASSEEPASYVSQHPILKVHGNISGERLAERNAPKLIRAFQLVLKARNLDYFAYYLLPSGLLASRWVLQTLRNIKSSDLEESLLVLPFSYVPDLLLLLNEFVKKGREIELVCRCVFFLARIHHGRITANHMLVEVLDELKTNTQSKLQQLRDIIGFNKVALSHLRKRIENNKNVIFFEDASREVKEKRKRKRKRTELQRAMISL